jgi:hypothetical protein
VAARGSDTHDLDALGVGGLADRSEPPAGAGTSGYGDPFSRARGGRGGLAPCPVPVARGRAGALRLTYRPAQSTDGRSTDAGPTRTQSTGAGRGGRRAGVIGPDTEYRSDGSGRGRGPATGTGGPGTEGRPGDLPTRGATVLCASVRDHAARDPSPVLYAALALCTLCAGYLAHETLVFVF